MIDSGDRNNDSAQRVLVRGLEVWSTIGVPDAEREQPQRLLIDLEVVPAAEFRDLDDEIERAVDYHALALRVKDVAGQGERRLIETLAVDIADVALKDRKIERLKVRIRKFILPDTEFVGVELVRCQGEGQLDG